MTWLNLIHMLKQSLNNMGCSLLLVLGATLLHWNKQFVLNFVSVNAIAFSCEPRQANLCLRAFCHYKF